MAILQFRSCCDLQQLSTTATNVDRLHRCKIWNRHRHDESNSIPNNLTKINQLRFRPIKVDENRRELHCDMRKLSSIKMYS